MKLKTRLGIAFLTIILIPVLMSVMVFWGLAKYQISSINETYEISGTTVESFSNSMLVIAQLTEKPYQEISKEIRSGSARLEDVTFWEEYNEELIEKKAYLLVRKDDTIIYKGSAEKKEVRIIDQLPEYTGESTGSENGIYLGGKAQVLVKQIDFTFEDEEEGSVFIVSDVSDAMPEVKEFLRDMLFGIIVVLIFTAILLVFWIYQGIMGPLTKMKKAANNIKEGNLEFELKEEVDDELGQLCRDLEDMRKRLKQNVEEKLQFDRENKELISNISHDLKTPVTTIKGYAEGILDGVADTPEKVDKYVRTIYNKANEMDTLINELTLYSKIDTNRIPYNFNIISVNDYFNDCAEELQLDMEAKNVAFGYFNYVEPSVRIIADREQLKRVIYNITNNSVKYMNKTSARINLRVKDVGDFIQVEIEDNGKGIAAKDLPSIFDRFYRTDASRNSSKGGSGIGLSIVKKIIEEHGGKIWATSREEVGTTMYFVLRKYQEVPMHE